jgi:hypothetical protein
MFPSFPLLFKNNQICFEGKGGNERLPNGTAGALPVILRRHNFKNACLIGHSFGSFVVSKASPSFYPSQQARNAFNLNKLF